MAVQKNEALNVLVDFGITLDPHYQLKVTYSFDKAKKINEVVDVMRVAGMIREASDNVLKLTPRKEPVMPEVKKAGDRTTAEELNELYSKGVFLAIEDMNVVSSNIYKAIESNFDNFTSAQVDKSVKLVEDANAALKKIGKLK